VDTRVVLPQPAARRHPVHWQSPENSTNRQTSENVLEGSGRWGLAYCRSPTATAASIAGSMSAVAGPSLSSAASCERVLSQAVV
jgi:hypothetical protein